MRSPISVLVIGIVAAWAAAANAQSAPDRILVNGKVLTVDVDFSIAQAIAISGDPDVDGGEEAVAGTVRMADRDTIAILRSDPRCGEVCVHFPRTGYRVACI